MFPVLRAAFPPPPAANDRQGLVRWRAEALRRMPEAPRRRPLRGLLLHGALLAVVLSLMHWAAHASFPRPPA